MMISRRKFLGSGSMLAVGAVAGSVAAVSHILPKARPAVPDRERFAAWIGTTFQVHAEALTVVPMRLAQVANGAAGKTQPLAGHELFSLVFEGPAEPVLRQQTYRMEHAEAGELAIFIVPIGRRGEAQQYEAVFHRPIPSA